MELSGNEQNKTTKSFLGFDNEEMKEMSSFFDLLARFDHEDKLKEKLALKTDPLVSAPKGSILGSNI